MNKLRKGVLKTNKKGFLGPIGDDLPSLIPIVFGLLIFFSIFNLGFQTFTRKSAAFDDSLLVLTVSDVLKGESIISGYDDFQAKCSEVNVTGMNFKAALIELPAPEDVSESKIIFNVHDLINCDRFECKVDSVEIFSAKINGKNELFKCSNIIDEDNLIRAGDSIVLDDRDEILARIFPVGFVDNVKVSETAEFAVKPMFLVVMMWA